MMAASPVEQRNFYLALSILEGQKLAHSAGFSIPSPEVQEHEIMDIMQKWFILSTTGILDMIKDCSSWMVNVLRENEYFDEDALEATENIITSYGVGLLAHLIDQEDVVLQEDYSPGTTIEIDIPSLLGYMLSVSQEDNEEEEDEE